MKKRLITGWLVLLAGKSLLAQNNPDVVTYINTYKQIAISEMQRSGIPASIILAQGIHETEAGTSDLVKKSNNHFGIKCKDDWTGAVVYHDDDARGECFRSYANPEDSYRDHSDFLRNSPRYASLFKLSPDNYQGWAYGLKNAGYATNTRYPQILIKLIQDYNLDQYTQIALGRINDTTGLAVTGKNPEATVSFPARPATTYPEGEFTINNTRVVFAKAGASLLSLANQYELSLPRLLEFNDLKEEDVLVNDQLLFLQRKRRTGATGFHVVRDGESLYDIAQVEGLRYEDLLQMNQLKEGDRPAVGEKIWLQSSAPSRPKLTENNVYVNHAGTR